MTVYLIHLDKPLSPDHTAQHYLGYSSEDNLFERLDAHKNGSGSRFLEVAKERHIGWHLVRTWVGGRTKERQLKNQKNTPRLCPICSVRNGYVAF